MPTTLPVLFRLLLGCGLRISEALNLTHSDVDLKSGLIIIRMSKFNKDRIVPLSASMQDILHAYSTKHHKLTSNDSTLFFVHRDGRAIKADSIYMWYRKVLWAAGISHGGRGNGPRVHDFRHTFSVYSLKAMTDKGMDIYCALPVLSTYLGHASVSATGQYVRLTQDMFPEIVAKTSAIAAYVIPGGGRS
jgi:integrase